MEYLESDLYTDAEEEDHGLALPAMRKPNLLYGRPRKSCHLTVDLCLHLIHQAMCKNQWEKAAGLLTSYFQTLENRHSDRQNQAPEILWRLGSEILLNHPKSSNGAIHVFHEYMKNIGLKKYLSVSLEQAFHIMCYGDPEDAHPALSTAESWRYGQHTIKEHKILKLIQAYKALLYYRSSVDKRAALSQHDLDFVSQSSVFQPMDTYSRQAAVIFKDILQFPGVWDPFVVSYVDLLESSGNEEEAEKVLREYAYNARNPANPNAYVYLYEFLKKNEASDEKLSAVLRDLYAKTPSHKLMLEFTKLLNKSDSEGNRKLALDVLFDLLDFSDWKENVEAWSYLAKQMKKTFQLDRSDWILLAWRQRRSWWPSYHFTKFHAKKDCKERAELAVKKALVAGMLQGPDCVYSTYVCASRECETMNINRVMRSIKKYNCANLPEPQTCEPEEVEATMDF